MKKIRIISEEHFGNKTYKVQRKKWYGWVTESIPIIAWRSIDKHFYSIEEAELYILKHFTKPKIKTVKNINVE